MNVLVDTSVWSLVLRRDAGHNQDVRKHLGDLIVGHRAKMIGPIRQEILSGIRDDSQFETLKAHLAAYPDIPIVSDDHVTAARFYNLCRRKGVQGSNTDFLICAVAVHHRFELMTMDKDFEQFARVLPITLHR